MPTGAQRIAAFAHPILALLGLLLLGYVASLGLRGRERGGAMSRRRHARLAPWALAALLLSFAAGIASTWWLRPDLEPASGAHFRIALAASAALCVAAVASRRVAASPLARALHPALGLLALLLSAVQVFFGLGLLPP